MTSAMNAHWHILGAGSMGCLWAYYLQKTGHTVTLVCRQPPAMPTLTLIRDGHHHSTNMALVTPQQADAIDNLLVCVKAPQTADALAAIAHAITPRTTLVLLQNGMGHHALAAQQFPANPLYCAVTTEAALRMQPLTVEHTGAGITQLGALSRNLDKQLLNKLHCELQTRQHPDIHTAMWQKLVVNCCINPLTVIYDCKNGELADNFMAQMQISDIINECRAVAAASGHEKTLATIDKQVRDVIMLTADNSSSMRQDLHHGRQTEIDYLNGYIAHLGEQLGIATPVNRQMYHQIRDMIDEND